MISSIGVSIPKTNQQSTLACPPSLNYIRQYIQNTGQNGIVTNYVRKHRPQTETPSSTEYDLGHNQDGNRPYTSNGVQETKGVLFSSNMSDVSVKKWIDYSSKFGLGYILSDGKVGVYFNDSTKIIYIKQMELISYILKEILQKKQK